MHELFRGEVLQNNLTSDSHTNAVALFFFFFIRTSNSGAEAERSYVLLQIEPETFLTRCYRTICI